MNGAFMAAEIAEQPAVFERILQEGRPAIQKVARLVRERQPRFVLFVARGTSDHAALYAKYLVETRLGLPAGLASPSSMTIYDARPDLRGVLLVAVSQSGISPDLVEPLARGRAAGATTLAVTNAPDSPLANAAEYHIGVLAGPERAVAATKTYTAQLLSLFLLFEMLRGESGVDAEGLPREARSLLGPSDEIASVAARYRFAEQLIVTSRGYNYATALEAALKLTETSYLVAHGFSAADLLHGPMAMIGRGFPVIAIAPKGPGGVALRPVLEQLQSLGADTMVLGDPEAVALGTVGLSLPVQVPEFLTPMLFVLPMQQLAWHMACERGADPDEPRGLHKVTQTW